MAHFYPLWISHWQNETLAIVKGQTLFFMTFRLHLRSHQVITSPLVAVYTVLSMQLLSEAHPAVVTVRLRDRNSSAGLSVAVHASMRPVQAHWCSLRNCVCELWYRGVCWISGSGSLKAVSVIYLMKAELFSWLHSELRLSSYLITLLF